MPGAGFRVFFGHDNRIYPEDPPKQVGCVVWGWVVTFGAFWTTYLL